MSEEYDAGAILEAPAGNAALKIRQLVTGAASFVFEKSEKIEYIYI